MQMVFFKSLFLACANLIATRLSSATNRRLLGRIRVKQLSQAWSLLYTLLCRTSSSVPTSRATNAMRAMAMRLKRILCRYSRIWKHICMTYDVSTKSEDELWFAFATVQPLWFALIFSAPTCPTPQRSLVNVQTAEVSRDTSLRVSNCSVSKKIFSCSHSHTRKQF